MPALPSGGTVRRAILREQRPRVTAAALCLMGHQACEALVPIAIGIAIDLAVASGEPLLLVASILGMIALFAALITCYRWFARFGQGAVIDASHALRSRIAARVLGPHAPNRPHGELLTIASSDADQAARSIIWVAGLAGAAAALLVSSAALLIIDLRLGGMLIAAALVVTCALHALSPHISRRVTRQQQTLASTSALATDLINGLRVLTGLGAERTATERYRRVSRDAQVAGVNAGTANAIQQGASVLAASVVLAVSVTYAGLLALEGAISIGAFVAAVGVAQFISEPMMAIGTYLQVGAAAKASAARVSSVLGADDPGDEPGGEPLDDQGDAGRDAARGARTQDDRTRDDRTQDARTGLDAIPVPEEGFVGVVASASHLDAALAALRPSAGRQMHIEPHRPDLFAGSLADNLALGNAAGDPNPAIDAAGAREFVAAHPAGLDAPVRDRGLTLSGGQRQRLALARALHTDPEVLVLIDPTTAVDSVTERTIAAGIRQLRHGEGANLRATVVFTSSPALLDRTDHVVFVQESGTTLIATHRELLAQDARYRTLVLG